jgi:SAM-dependent methyltransferase
MSDTNTAVSFRDKWEQNPALAFEQTLREGSDTNRWIISRNGFPSMAAFSAHLRGVRRILDAGCGNGRVTALLRTLTDPAQTEVVGIDLVAADVARTNLAHYDNVHIETRDLLGSLDDLGQFDFIYCQEVLHHTADPAAAFANVALRLAAGGELAVYVYKRKAPIREYVDDFVRERIASLPYEEALRVSEQITALGRALAGIGATVRIPAVDVLGIEEGEYDIQRFVYHFFMKCYWNDDMTFRENAVVNYDWYHPQLCTRHTPEEVRGWFHRAGLQVIHECVDFYGITMRGVAEGSRTVSD